MEDCAFSVKLIDYHEIIECITGALDVLTGADGKTVELEPIRDGRDAYRLYSVADASGVYTIICDINDNEAHHVCATCFFVGDCEAAIPKAPAVPVLFVPDMWEEPDYYKLISLYLRKYGKPVPFAPLTLTFQNRNGCIEKELSTDDSGNVFFAPYMGGTYCLTSKSMSDDIGEGEPVEVTTAFSFLLSQRGVERLRTRKRAFCGL